MMRRTSLLCALGTVLVIVGAAGAEPADRSGAADTSAAASVPTGGVAAAVKDDARNAKAASTTGDASPFGTLLPGACCTPVGCFIVNSPSECNGTYLGEGSTCAQCVVDGCCRPWDNGRFDGRGGQTSQIGVDEHWQAFGRVAFDDFWLCEGQINYILNVRGTMSTNSLIPKVLVVILPDCDGRPDIMRPLGVAGLQGTRFDVDQEDVPFVLGRVGIVDNQPPDADGFRQIIATASFDLSKLLVLKGGAYWVTFIGVSGNLNPLDEFFWQTSGRGVIKGKPGVFYNDGQWFDSDLLCCGCTDYNFCIEGETCKILLDNGPPVVFGAGRPIIFPGVASLQNGTRTSDKSRAADKLVLPPCDPFLPCYLEGWVWTNCDRIGLQLFADDCHCPSDDGPATVILLADCVMGTGEFLPDPTGVQVELKKAQWFFHTPGVLTSQLGPDGFLTKGRNLWVSLFGIGDNNQNARAYFAFASRCDRPCNSFGPGCFRAAPFDQTSWRPNGIRGTSVPGFDHAFLIAVREVRVTQLPATAPCPADFNSSGQVSVQDIFDFLAAWFAGCP